MLHIIVGLPGSGKTRNTFRKLNKTATGICADDYLANANLPENYGIKRHVQFNDSKYYQKLIRDLRRNRTCVISDILFCDSLVRAEIELLVKQDAPSTEIKWWFYENKPKKCIPNIINRARSTERVKREITLVKQLSKKYFIPKDAKIIKIYSGN